MPIFFQFGDDLMSAIFFFGMSNSVVNPIIYGAFSLWPVGNRNRKKGTFNNNNNRSSFTRYNGKLKIRFMFFFRRYH